MMTTIECPTCEQPTTAEDYDQTYDCCAACAAAIRSWQRADRTRRLS